jgi:hypothetical protein
MLWVLSRKPHLFLPFPPVSNSGVMDKKVVRGVMSRMKIEISERKKIEHRWE